MGKKTSATTRSGTVKGSASSSKRTIPQIRRPDDRNLLNARYELLDLYFARCATPLTWHQISSADEMIDVTIPRVLQRENVFHESTEGMTRHRHMLTFDNLTMIPPTSSDGKEIVFPDDVAASGESYMGTLMSTVTQWHEKRDLASGEVTKVVIGAPENDVPVARIPIMVRSKYCNLTLSSTPLEHGDRYDQGGYFVVNGAERVVSTLEAAIQRKPMVKIFEGCPMVSVQSRPSTMFAGAFKSFNIRFTKKGELIASSPRLKNVPVFLLIRALEIERDQDIIDMIANPSEHVLRNMLNVALSVSIAESNAALTADDAIRSLSTCIASNRKYDAHDENDKNDQRKAHLYDILSNEVLPHVSQNNTTKEAFHRKACYIGYMIRILLIAVSKNKDRDGTSGIPTSDRDGLPSKRFEVSGYLLSGLFELALQKLLKDCGSALISRSSSGTIPPIIEHIRDTVIEHQLRQVLLTGKFGHDSRVGVSEKLERQNNLGTLSGLRKIVVPTSDTTSKIIEPRLVHPTQYGTICPFETPQGKKTGLVKSLALGSNITVSMHSQIPIVMEYLTPRLTPIQLADKQRLHVDSKVFLDGNWLGMTQEAMVLLREMREMRFRQELHHDVSVSYSFPDREFRIRTEPGRAIRPYLCVWDNRLAFQPEMLEGITSWNEFLIKHPRVIEYLDKEEEENMVLAALPSYVERELEKMNRPAPTRKETEKVRQINATNRYGDNVFLRYTHCEIDPSMILGASAAIVPHANCDQGPRILFQCAQIRNGVGVPRVDYIYRLDTTHILYHFQKPIIATRASVYTNNDVKPAGENIIVAVAVYTGYNQEDSLIVNRSAIDCGMFRCASIKIFSDNINKDPASAQATRFGKPDPSKTDGMKAPIYYEKLNEEGHVSQYTILQNRDMVIGVMKPRNTVGPKELPFIDKSVVYNSPLEGEVGAVRRKNNTLGYMSYTIPVTAERIPQIGDKLSSLSGQKGTIGIVLSRTDMPYTASGLCPDLIISPSALPTRMTIGHLIECLQATLCATTGYHGDATPFQDADHREYERQLQEIGMEFSGYETMYNGFTGEQMEVMIFIGPTYYQRLKQMSIDKARARSVGLVESVSRQPVEGGKMSGGLRFGEMEVWGLATSGAAQFLKEIMMDNSDSYTVRICDLCGNFASQVPPAKHYQCISCRDTRTTTVVMAYAFKLMLQELRSINISPKLRTANSISLPSRY